MDRLQMLTGLWIALLLTGSSLCSNFQGRRWNPGWSEKPGVHPLAVMLSVLGWHQIIRIGGFFYGQ